jgi:hypothetical protein
MIVHRPWPVKPPATNICTHNSWSYLHCFMCGADSENLHRIRDVIPSRGDRSRSFGTLVAVATCEDDRETGASRSRPSSRVCSVGGDTRHPGSAVGIYCRDVAASPEYLSRDRRSHIAPLVECRVATGETSRCVGKSDTYDALPSHHLSQRARFFAHPRPSRPPFVSPLRGIK